MINAISPAAKYSPMITEAISAMDTSTSALISKAVTSPTIASATMGSPHSTMATQAGSQDRGQNCSRASRKLTSRPMPPSTRKITSRLTPPRESSPSTVFFITIPPSGQMGIGFDSAFIIPIGV
jgi:hypothetical protein